MNKLNLLYDEVIKRHNSHPYHFEKKERTSIQAYNPICGDRFDLYLDLENGRINAAHFHGFGCAVSKASTSVLIETIEGKTTVEAKAICDQFLRLLKNEIVGQEPLFSEDFQSFSMVQTIPARLDCAALGWMELEKFLSDLLSHGVY